MESSPYDPAGERILALLARARQEPTGASAPQSRARSRGREIVVLREDGFSLSEIAERYGVSRERVRQILRANDGPGSAEAVAARRRRHEREAERRVADLLARWRAGDRVGAIAADLGIQAALCQTMVDRFATDMDRAARRASIAIARGRRHTYSDRDILEALALAAARLGETPTPRRYAELARELELPSLPTILNRLGSWTQALAAAGLPSRAPGGRAGMRRWSDDDCRRALLQVTDELGEAPTVRAYERAIAGRDAFPSSATIRKRLGRWSTLVAHLAAARGGAQRSVPAPPADAAARPGGD